MPDIDMPPELYCDTCQTQIGWRVTQIVTVTARRKIDDVQFEGGESYCLDCGLPEEEDNAAQVLRTTV